MNQRDLEWQSDAEWETRYVVTVVGDALVRLPYFRYFHAKLSFREYLSASNVISYSIQIKPHQLGPPGGGARFCVLRCGACLDLRMKEYGIAFLAFALFPLFANSHSTTMR